MLAISVPMLAAFIAAWILANYAARMVIFRFPDSPKAQGLAALVM